MEQRTKISLCALIFLSIASIMIDVEVKPVVSAQQDVWGEVRNIHPENWMREDATIVVLPVYPEEAVQQDIAGVVEIMVGKSAAGDVVRAKISSTIHPLLRHAVIEAVRGWKFKTRPPSPDPEDLYDLGILTFNFAINEGRGDVELYTPVPDSDAARRMRNILNAQDSRNWEQWEDVICDSSLISNCNPRQSAQ